MVVVGDPGGPWEPPDFPEEGKPCRIRVTLLWVLYGGKDVGSSWRYTVVVNGRMWQSGKKPRVMHWRRRDDVGALVYDEKLDNYCDADPPVSVWVQAREDSSLLFDDVGDGVEMAFVPCRREESSKQLSVLVPVPEFQLSIFHRLFRRSENGALLAFIFDIKTQCVD